MMAISTCATVLMLQLLGHNVGIAPVACSASAGVNVACCAVAMVLSRTAESWSARRVRPRRGPRWESRRYRTRAPSPHTRRKRLPDPTRVANSAHCCEAQQQRIHVHQGGGRALDQRLAEQDARSRFAWPAARRSLKGWKAKAKRNPYGCHMAWPCARLLVPAQTCAPHAPQRKNWTIKRQAKALKTYKIRYSATGPS